MPALDRRITLHLEAEGTRDDQGDYVPGPTTDYPVWARIVGAGSSDSATGEGSRINRISNFLVRWFLALEQARVDRVTITDEHGRTWNADTIGESDARRRALTVTAIEVAD